MAQAFHPVHDPKPSATDDPDRCPWCGRKLPKNRPYNPFCTLACGYRFGRQAHIDGVRYKYNPDSKWIVRNFSVNQETEK